MKDKIKNYIKRNSYVFYMLGVGLSLLGCGCYIQICNSAMVYDYNQGLACLQSGKNSAAELYFKKVIVDYKKHEIYGNFISKAFSPLNSSELAALSYFHLGNVYFKDMHLNLAVKAYENSLKINSGNDYSIWQALSYKRLHKEALDTKFNLEALFAQNPQMQKAQGQKHSSTNNQGQQQGGMPNRMPGHGVHHSKEPPPNTSGI